MSRLLCFRAVANDLCGRQGKTSATGLAENLGRQILIRRNGQGGACDPTLTVNTLVAQMDRAALSKGPGAGSIPAEGINSKLRTRTLRGNDLPLERIDDTLDFFGDVPREI
jgi:hypothetical protein